MGSMTARPPDPRGVIAALRREAADAPAAAWVLRSLPDEPNPVKRVECVKRLLAALQSLDGSKRQQEREQEGRA